MKIQAKIIALVLMVNSVLSYTLFAEFGWSQRFAVAVIGIVALEALLLTEVYEASRRPSPPVSRLTMTSGHHGLRAGDVLILTGRSRLDEDGAYLVSRVLDDSVIEIEGPHRHWDLGNRNGTMTRIGYGDRAGTFGVAK